MPKVSFRLRQLPSRPFHHKLPATTCIHALHDGKALALAAALASYFCCTQTFDISVDIPKIFTVSHSDVGQGDLQIDGVCSWLREHLPLLWQQPWLPTFVAHKRFTFQLVFHASFEGEGRHA